MSQDDVPIERDNHALITEDVDVATTEVPERSHEQEMVISQPAIPDSDIDPSFSTGLLILIGPALIAGYAAHTRSLDYSLNNALQYLCQII